MIKKYSLVFIVFLCSFSYGVGQSDIIISQYIETDSGTTPKGIEVFNVSGADIVLSVANNLQIYQGTNGASCNGAALVNLTAGTLKANEVWVIGTSNLTSYATTNGTGLSGITTFTFTFNGNDALRITLGGTVQDMFGNCGSDPGNSWVGSGVDSRNNNLQVKGGLCDGDINGWTDPSERFDEIANGVTMTGFGNSPVSCSFCTSPADPNGTIAGTTPACASTTLTYTGTDTTPLLLLNYWQISANGTDQTNDAVNTYNATSTGTYYVRKYDVAADCWSANSISYNVVIDSAIPNITTQPANQNEIIPNTATFNVVAGEVTTYQWEINTGSGWGIITGATTNTYITASTSAPMNGYQYRCVLTNTCGSINSNAVTLTLTNNAPNNVIDIRGCFEDNSVVLDWNAPASGATPTGYVVFALDGGTDPAGTKTDANTYTADSNFSTAITVTPASLGKVVYKGTATTATITGLTEDNNYSFTTYAYVGDALTGWSGGATNGSTVTNGLAQDDVRNLMASPDNTQVTLNWNNPLPTSCFDEIVIFANEGAVSINPTGDGSAYPENSVYTTPNQAVYKGKGTVRTITGLTNETNYCFKAYVRRGTTWSDGIEVCETPIITYCNATSSSDAFNTGITGVIINTLNNTGTTANNTYVDYTNLSTNVEIGTSYDISVNVNVDGSGTVYSRVWIDWNIDGDFNDSNEEYDLGTLFNPSGNLDGTTSESPLSIEVPTTAVAGSTRMRVSAKWASNPTSCEDNYRGEIEDYTLVIDHPANAEINIKGNNITIPNGFNTPYGLNNTLFGGTDLTGPYTEKSYFISNLGLSTLDLTNNPIVEIIGTNSGDFIVTQQPSANSIVSGAGDLEFKIEFRPTLSGHREAQVRIYNNDSTGGENPYIFDIEGTGTCSTSITTNMWPNEGAEDTEITITSATDLTGATAELNGLTLPIVSSNAGELIVTIPNGATDGNIVILFSTGCTSTQSFDVLDEIISTCQGSSGATTPTDLFISEVSDATNGSSSLIEIFNGTASNIDLSNYSIRVFNNGSSSPSTTSNLTGTLNPGGVHVISIGTTSCDLTVNGLAGGLPNQTFNSAGGINFDNNSSDMMDLYNSASTTVIDVFGVFGSNNWANSLGIAGDGVNYRRQNTAASLPDLTFDITDWDEIDWTSCGDSDYSGFGLYDFSLGVPPTVTLDPVANNTNCDASVDLTVAGSEGSAGGLGLAYRWFYLAPNNSTWAEITSDGGPYTGFNQATLNVNFSDVIDVNGYQYYCQIRENIESCYTASKAVKINHERAFWNVNSWSSTPDIDKLVVINSNYNTNGNIPNGEISFEACSLIVNASATLTVDNTTYVEIENNVIVKGNLVVQTQGAFVQNDNAGTFVLSGAGTSQVNKTTSPLTTIYNYTYWSSPVKDALIGTALFTANPNRLYYFDASAFQDPDGDGIDDIGDDWKLANLANIMEPGRGYASTHTNIGFVPGNSYQYNFAGEFNTGTILEPLSNNIINTTDHWNLVGNPYPSAINVNDPVDGLFVINNGIIKPEVYMWSQYRPPLGTNPGNDVLNFSQDDYITINSTGPVGNGSDLDGDGNVDIPDEYIPSGQSFFVSSLAANNLTFNNAMRISGDNSNTQFFEPNNGTENKDNNSSYADPERFWLNLVSDNGAANQLLVGYINEATDDFDLGYDTKRNLSSNNSTIIYTGINDISNEKFVIQGKNSNSLSVKEVIPIGFKTTINVPTIFTFSLIKLEGSFLENNNVYLKDNLLNAIHNLKTSDYNFTSEIGEYNDRFEIVFTEDALSLGEVKVENNALHIIELQNGDVQFKVSSQYELKSIEIIDLLGRTLYKLNAQGNSQTFTLSNLSQTTYLAKVELTNGYVITKKALKRR